MKPDRKLVTTKKTSGIFRSLLSAVFYRLQTTPALPRLSRGRADYRLLRIAAFSSVTFSIFVFALLPSVMSAAAPALDQAAWRAYQNSDAILNGTAGTLNTTSESMPFGPAIDSNGPAFGSVASTAGTATIFASAVDSTNGYIYLAGSTDSTDWRIEKRYLASGEPVTQFGINGSIISPTGYEADAIAIDTTGGYMYVSGNDNSNTWLIQKRKLSTGQACSASAGCDATFGTDGSVTSLAGFSTRAIALDTAGGYMYAVGRDGSLAWLIQKRKLSTGQACSLGAGCDGGTFGTDGSIKSSMGGNGIPYAIAIDIAGGYMYVAGNNDDFDWIIQKRKLSTGQACSAVAGCDYAFGIDGSVKSPAGSYALAIAIDTSGGYMYISGSDSPDTDWLIQKRKLSTGQACSAGAGCDATFGTDGSVTSPTGTRVRAIAIDTPGGFMYAGGYDDSNNWRIEKRLMTTGALCSGSYPSSDACGSGQFGTQGVITGESATNKIYSINLDSSGNLYAAGDTNTDGGAWLLRKYNATTGAPDRNFGVGHVTSPLPDTGGWYTKATAVDTSGGYMYLVGGTGAATLLQKRRLSDGRICSPGVCAAGTFGSNGSLTDGTASFEKEYIVLDAAMGNIYIGGTTDTDWVLEKRRADTGALCASGAGCDAVFGTDGNITSPIGKHSPRIAIDAAGGYLYAAGYDDSDTWLIQKRLLSTGRACSPGVCTTGTFGSNGSVSSPIGTWLYALAIDSTYMYVTGYSGPYWLIQKRRLDDGRACSTGVCGADTFGTTGSVTSLDGSRARAIAIDSTYMYVVGDDDSSDWFIQKRKLSTGQACSAGAGCAGGTFGTDGSVKSAVGNIPFAAAIDTAGGYLYIGGTDNSANWLIQKRKLSTGQVCSAGAGCDAAFGTFGSIMAKHGGGSAELQDVVLDMTGGHLYAVGFNSSIAGIIQKRRLSDGLLTGGTTAQHDSGFGSGESGAPFGVVGSVAGVWDAKRVVLDEANGYFYTTLIGTGYVWRMEKRYLVSGELVAQFGINGVVTSTFLEYPDAMVLDSAGGYLYVGGTSITDSEWLIQKRRADTGQVCSPGVCATGTFGTNGSVLSRLSNVVYQTMANSIALDTAGGYIYVAGNDPATGDRDWIIQKRRTDNGRACSPGVCAEGTFGIDGSVLSTAGTSLTSIAIDTNAGYLYAAGKSANGNWLIQKRLLSTGQACSAGVCAAGTFGTNGSVQTFYGWGTAVEIILDIAGGYMYVGGIESDYDWAIQKRRLSDGRACGGGACASGNFGTDGSIIIDGNAASLKAVSGLALDAAGYLYVGGMDTGRWRIEKRRADTGVLCSGSYPSSDTCGSTQFGTQGVILKGTGPYQVNDIAVASTGSLYAVGIANSADWGASAANIRKYSATTGAPDRYFGPGQVTSPNGNIAYAIAIDSTYMYVAGDDGTTNWLIQKRKLSTGQACSVTAGCDATFGTDGSVTSPIGDTAYAIAIDSAYMYVVGSKGGGPYDWLIQKRKLSDGKACTATAGCDATFGTDGSVQSPIGQVARGIAIDSTYMYVAGYDDTLDWFIQKRKLSTGQACSPTAGCDATFGANGSVKSLNTTISYAITIDGTYMYVAGYDSASDWLIQKRRLDNGRACSAGVCGADTFGTDGSVKSPNGTAAYAIAIDSTYMYVAGNNESLSDWLIQKRKLSTGQACSVTAGCDATFGTDGSVTSLITTIAEAITIDGTYMYVAGYMTGTDWLIQKRKLSTGQACSATAGCDATFGTDGSVKGSPDSSIAQAIVIDSTHMYVAGYMIGNDWLIQKRRLTDGLYGEGKVFAPSYNISTPLATQDNPATLASSGQTFRLRTVINVSTSTMLQNWRPYKLQYAGKGTTGTCSAPAGTPSAWTDVGTSGTLLTYYSLPNIKDGYGMTASPSNDPEYSTYASLSQTYEESNPFINSVSQLTANQNAVFDFSLKASASAPTCTTYCLRVVENNMVNTPSVSFSKYPEITTYGTECYQDPLRKNPGRGLIGSVEFGSGGGAVVHGADGVADPGDGSTEQGSGGGTSQQGSDNPNPGGGASPMLYDILWILFIPILLLRRRIGGNIETRI